MHERRISIASTAEPTENVGAGGRSECLVGGMFAEVSGVRVLRRSCGRSMGRDQVGCFCNLACAGALSDVCLCVARGMLAVWLTSGLCVCECVWMDSRAGWLVWLVAKRARAPFGL